MNTTRIAKCSCSLLAITFVGDPASTAVCNCTRCQKRTGSAFGVSAYFKDDQVLEIIGQGKLYIDDSSDSKKQVKRTFCGNCGTTVFWNAEFRPGYTGVAVGCFVDCDFPEPTAAVWNGSKLNWVSFPEHWLCLDKQSVP